MTNVRVSEAMVTNDAYFLHTMVLPWDGYPRINNPSCRITTTLGASLLAYLESARCDMLGRPSKKLLRLCALRATPQYAPCARSERLLAPRSPPAFYTNFIAGWLGLFQSPQMLQFAEAWYFWPGSWRFRWCAIALCHRCSCPVPTHACATLPMTTGPTSNFGHTRFG